MSVYEFSIHQTFLYRKLNLKKTNKFTRIHLHKNTPHTPSQQKTQQKQRKLPDCFEKKV